MKSRDTQSDCDAIIFSLADGVVWASWLGKSGRVELGRYAGVTSRMRSFLAQCELGERMAANEINQEES